MPTPFAALEADLNRSVMVHMANAEAVIGTQDRVEGIFEQQPATVLDVYGNIVQFSFMADQITVELTQDMRVDIGERSYRVDSWQDESGFITLTLKTV